jgi:hypothetical protein
MRIVALRGTAREEEGWSRGSVVRLKLEHDARRE